MSELSELLRRITPEGWSARRISREARQRGGHTLSHDTVSKYLRGDHAQPDEATLAAFADALSTNVARLREAAGILTDDHGPFELPAEAARLTRRQREAVMYVVRAMLDPGSKVPDGADETRETVSGSVTSQGQGKSRRGRSKAG